MLSCSNHQTQPSLLSVHRDPRESLHLALPGNVHLKENQQKLTDGDIEVLVKVLKGNTYITSLDLRYNRITDSGAKLLAQTIKVYRDRDIYTGSLIAQNSKQVGLKSKTPSMQHLVREPACPPVFISLYFLIHSCTCELHYSTTLFHQ